MWQRGGWAPKGGWTRDGVLARTLGLEGWIGGSHIDWRREWGSARMWAPKEGGLWDPTSVGEENKTFFIRVWKPLPSRSVLKPWGKVQRGQYLVVVDLGCYKWYQSQTPGDVTTRRLSLEEGWPRDGMLARTLDSKGGWIVRSHMGWGGEQNILYKGVETSP